MGHLLGVVCLLSRRGELLRNIADSCHSYLERHIFWPRISLFHSAGLLLYVRGEFFGMRSLDNFVAAALRGSERSVGS